MSFSPRLEALINAFRCLPGVGPKSAQRMALHLLERDREGGLELASALNEAVEKIGHCNTCQTFSETPVCDICESSQRDSKTLCILETPVDLYAVEQTGGYNGLYFVLGGHLSPIDGIGPDELAIDKLFARLEEGLVEEVILATNPTVEGEATAHYIAEHVKTLDIRITRIAHGVPVGGELEFVDGGTLAHAMAGRRTLS